MAFFEDEDEWVIDIDIDQIEDLYDILRDQVEPEYFEGSKPMFFYEDEDAGIVYVSNAPLTPEKIIAFYEQEEEEEEVHGL